MRNEADLSAYSRSPGHLLATDFRGPAARLEQTPKQSEKRGLSGAIGSEESQRLAGLHAQRHPVHRTPGSKGSGDGIRLHHRDGIAFHVEGKVLLWRMVCKTWNFIKCLIS